MNVIFISGVQSSGTTLLHELIYQRYQNTIKIVTEDSPFKVDKVDNYKTGKDYIRGTLIPDDLCTNTIREMHLNVYKNEIEKNAIDKNHSTYIIDKAPTLHLKRAEKLKKAFPESKFVIIFRDPVYVIEGLHRKWNLFKNSSVSDLCNFWEEVHADFLNKSKDFAGDVFFVRYESLIKQPDYQLREIANFCSLVERSQIMKIKDKANIPRMGLRNVVKGVIVINKEETSSVFTLSNQESHFVKTRLNGLYQELILKSEISNS